MDGPQHQVEGPAGGFLDSFHSRQPPFAGRGVRGGEQLPPQRLGTVLVPHLRRRQVVEALGLRRGRSRPRPVRGARPGGCGFTVSRHGRGVVLQRGPRRQLAPMDARCAVGACAGHGHPRTRRRLGARDVWACSLRDRGLVAVAGLGQRRCGPLEFDVPGVRCSHGIPGAAATPSRFAFLGGPRLGRRKPPAISPWPRLRSGRHGRRPRRDGGGHPQRGGRHPSPDDA